MRYLLLLPFFLLSHLAFAQNTQLEVEPNHSTVGFNLSIAGFSMITGKFTDYRIYLDWNADDITQSRIEAVIQASSINTGIKDRDQHLQSADFFNVENHPTITFTSDSIRRVNYAHYEAFGKFSMHGVSKDIILPFEIVKIDGNTVGIRSRTSINRQEYGVGADFSHTSMPEFLADEVEVVIAFWTRKRKQKK